MPNCKVCMHYKPTYMPALHKLSMQCELPKRNPGCKGDFTLKYVDTGKPKAFIKRRK